MNEFEVRLALRRSESMRGKPLTRDEWGALARGVLIPLGFLLLLVVFLPK